LTIKLITLSIIGYSNVNLEISNISGISDGSAEIKQGINTVQASNWQGKSSFVNAIATAFGIQTPLTEGEESGKVSIDLGEERYEVHLERDSTQINFRGNPVLEDRYDRMLVDLFAFLGEDNEVRQAVRNGENLKGVLTRPLEIEDIDSRIRDLSNERDSVESELERAEAKAEELVSLKQRRNKVETELEDLRERETEFDNAIVSETREQLSDLRAERDRVTDLIERLERTLKRSREKLASVYDEYEEISVEDPGDIGSEIEEIRQECERAREDREILQSIFSANKRLLEEDRVELLTDVDRGMMGDSHACWLCGSETTTDELEAQLDEISDEVLTLKKEVSRYEDQIKELEDERDEIRQQRRRKGDLEAKITELEETISERGENLSSAKERLESIESRIEDLETEAEGVDEEISDIRSEIKYKEAMLEDLANEIEDAETAADRVDMLEQEKEKLTEEIIELRNRKEEIEMQLRNEFDQAIQKTVRRFETGFEHARLTSEFELVIAREGREIEIDVLSEGEIELIGLVTAIAGYEAYDVSEITPIMILDQLGGLSDSNLSILADYLNDHTEILVMTAYPENTTFGNNKIDPAGWEMVKQARAKSA
jgi:predicted  nucleic acid-binding Zn-ribbon protein